MPNVNKPWKYVWECGGVESKPSTMTLMPDLCIHLVFDLSGTLDDEPFILNPNPELLALDMPPSCHLVGLAWPIWIGSDVLVVQEQMPTVGLFRSVHIDTDWAFYLYFELLEQRNRTNGQSLDILSVLAPFASFLTNSLLSMSNQPVELIESTHMNAVDDYSERHKRRIYREKIGLSPKQVQRIIRFNRLLDQLRAGEEPDYSDYYDQAHAIREFKRMAGITPREYQRRNLSKDTFSMADLSNTFQRRIP